MSRIDAAQFLVVLVIIVIVLAAICFVKTQNFILGGGPVGNQRRNWPPKSPHIVVDTLNLAHWLRSDKEIPLTVEEIVAAIDRTAPVLKKKHAGRVMYVLKDRESQLNSKEAHERYMACAERNRIYIEIAEKYTDPPHGNPRSAAHSASGRDDFLIAVLASRWKCSALTEDRLRDFDEFKLTLQPFHAFEFAYWRNNVVREFFRPEASAYKRLRKPHTVRFSEYF